MRRIIVIAITCAALAISAAAQRRGGVPASVTSFGFGGQRGFGGVPASVASPGFGFVPRGFGPRVFIGHHPRFFGPRFTGNRFFFPGSVSPFFPGAVSPFFGAPAIVPFFDWEDGTAAQPQTIVTQPAQPQPIVIVVPERGDRGGDDGDPAEREPAPKSREQVVPVAKPEPPPTPTIIVLRNGQKLELTDYAITGDTLYDLRGGRAKKIAVSDIDLAATVRINEERGLEFTLPNAARVNIQ